MRKPVLITGAIPLLLAAAPAWAQLDADTEVVRGKGPATSARLGDNSGANIGRSENSIAANGNPSGSRPPGPNGNPAGSNVTRDTRPNHAVDGRGNIDATFGTVNGAGTLNGAGPAPEPLTSGSSNEANAAIVRPRDRVNGNPSATSKPATPGTANNPGGSFTPGFNGNANEGSNLPTGDGNGNRRGGNSIDTGLLNGALSRNDNGGPAFGGDNSIFGAAGNSAGSPDEGSGPEWADNNPDATDNGAAAKRGASQGGGSGDSNSDDAMHGDGNSGPQDSAGNRNDKDGSGAKSGSDDDRRQDRNSGGGDTERDGGSGGGGGANDNKPSTQNGGGAPDRPEEEFGGSGNPFTRAIAGRRAGEIVGRGLGRDVTGAHRDEERQDNEDAGAIIGGRRNVLTGDQAVTAPNAKGPSPLLRKIVKDAQERKKSQ